jgi:glycosyltransferase involved in cell wall biosynthesis
MKILVATPYYHPKIGGLENYARQLNIALQQQEGWEVVVVTSNHEGKQTRIDTADGMKVYRLGTLLKFSNTPLSPLWPLQMRKVIRQERPDFILAHSPVPSMADAAALAAGSTPLVVAYHAATLLKGDSKLFDTVARVYRMYEQFTFWRARRIMAVSEYVKTGLGARLQSKTVVVPNAVWEREIQPRPQTTGTELLFISSLDRTHAWKGLDQIIDAIRIYTEQYGAAVHLTVMGDGNHREQYEAHAKQAGVAAHITFVGAKVGAEKDQIIQNASALVAYPTSANDAFPTVLLEAWAKGVPVVAAAIGPLPSLVNDGVDGFLAAPGDPAALAQRLHAVLTGPKELLSTVAANAAVRTREHYTWERQAKAVAQIAREITR